MRVNKTAGRILASVLVATLVMAPCAQAKGKSGKKANGVAYHVRAKTGDIVEITATDVHPPGSKTKTEIENEVKEEKDKITNGQAGDPDAAGEAWKKALGLGDGSSPQNVDGKPAMLTPEELQALLDAGAKKPEGGGNPRTPEEQAYLDRARLIQDAMQSIVDEANSDPSAGSRSPEERVQDAVDQAGDPFAMIDLPEATPDDIKLPEGALEDLFSNYQQGANDGYVGSTNAELERDPGYVTDIQASNVSDSETDKDTFCWKEITQTNKHNFGFTEKTNTFLEYTGFCSNCYEKAKKELTALADAHEKKTGKKLSQRDKLIDATAKEYSRYSKSKLCHCGKFIRCDALSGDYYQNKYGTDIRVDVSVDGDYDVDSFYMRDTDGSWDGTTKPGESNHTSISHTDAKAFGDGKFRMVTDVASDELVHAPGYALYDNFTNELMVSADDVSGAGKNRIAGIYCYSEKTAKMTLAEIRAAAEKNNKNLPKKLKDVGYENSASFAIMDLEKLPNAENRTLEDLLKEKYGTKGERIFQVKRADSCVTEQEYKNQHSSGGQTAGGGEGSTGNTDNATVEPENGQGNNRPGAGEDPSGITGGAETSNGEAGQDSGTNPGSGQNPGGTGQGDRGSGTNPGGGQKPGGTNPSSGTGTDPNTPGGDENNDETFDAEDVLIKLYGGAAGMDGVRKNVRYQELLKKFKNEEDLIRFINGLIESGYIEKGKTPSEWASVLAQEAEEYDRATSESYEVKYYYSSSGEQVVGQEKEYNLIINYKYDLYDENDKKIIDGREWGGGSTYWVAGSAGKYTVKRWAEVWKSITKTVQITESLRVVDSKGNEIYNRSWVNTRVDAYGLKEEPSHWTNEGIRDIVITVTGGNSQMFATSRVH